MDIMNTAGSAANITPWGYLWRRDRVIQDTPEAEFIPRRLRRQDEVYRTAYAALGAEGVRSICYRQKDFEEQLLPKPRGNLLTGLLWTGGLTDYTVTLIWPDDVRIPAPDEIEIRTFPTAWGWFGWSVDKIMTGPDISSDNREWTYKPPAQTIDYAYNQRVKAQTEMVAVFSGDNIPVPELHVTGGSLGTWRELEFRVEWGFAGNMRAFTGDIDTNLVILSEPVFSSDRCTATYHCLYSTESRFGVDSRVTFVTDRSDGCGATVLLRELALSPICVPECGLYFAPAGDDRDAAQYIADCSAVSNQNIRDRIREHAEAESWDELMYRVRLWRCPKDTEVPPFPNAPEPCAVLSVPDKRWESMYKHAVEQLRGPHMWGMLSAEVARAALAMEMAGLNEGADKIYDYFLTSPGIKSDGDFTDPAGSLEWAKSMRHDMGYAHEGTHSCTGKLIFSMMYRYCLTADRDWLEARMPRLKSAASWIINEIRSYMKDIPNRERLHCFGLMPPSMLGDYALPACDWRWYYCDNAFTQMGLSLFAQVLEKIGDPDALYYIKEARIYENDLRAAVIREALRAPVRRGSDGMSRSFIPRMAYCGGLLLYGEETNIPQFALGINDLFQGALPVGEIGCVMDASDRRIVGTIDGMEEAGMKVSLGEPALLDHPTAGDEIKKREAELKKAAGGIRADETDDRWFWSTFSNLPKISHNANIYLRQDDIENFLRFFFNHAIVMVGANGRLWEHAHPDIYVDCEDPDNGTAGWFVENFRNMLVTEDPFGPDVVLWLAKGTPRAWLRQGCEIAVSKTMTFFGELSYRILSDTDKGVITANIHVPAREQVPILKLRLRHPDGKKIRSLTVNGIASPGSIDSDGETVILAAPAPVLDIVAEYQV